MNAISQPIPGSVVPGKVNPNLVFIGITNRPRGKIKRDDEHIPLQHKAKDMGDERHKQLLTAIKGLSVTQNVKQETRQALPQHRDAMGRG